MKLEAVEFQKALEDAATLPYALIIEYSRVFFGKTPASLNHAEWIEAHFFGPDREIRFMSAEGSLEASVLADEPGDRHLDAKLRFRAGGSAEQYASVRNYLKDDEDGQACVVGVRLMSQEDAPCVI